MAQFVSKQKAVFEQLVQKESTNETEIMAEAEIEQSEREKRFECVICNSAASMSIEQPIGLVVQTQATSG